MDGVDNSHEDSCAEDTDSSLALSAAEPLFRSCRTVV